MATENQENYNLWRHFLSSLKKSKFSFTPEKQKDVFLGNIDCFSTNLSRKLLGTSGQKIETELTPSSIKKLKTRALWNEVKHEDRNIVPKSRSQDAPSDVETRSYNDNYKQASKPKENPTFTKVLAVDTKLSEEFDEPRQKGSDTVGVSDFAQVGPRDIIATDLSRGEDVTDSVKMESDSFTSEVLRKQSTKVIEPDLFEEISAFGKLESSSIPSEVLRKQTTKLIEQGMQETSSVTVEVKKEGKSDSEMSKKESKEGKSVTGRFSGLVNSFQGHAPSSNFIRKCTKLKVKSKKQNFAECFNQKAVAVEENLTTVHTIPGEAISEINENVKTDRVRQRYTNKHKRKIDVDISCSSWTLDMLANYVDFKQSVGEIEQKMELGTFQSVIDRAVKQTTNQIKDVQQVIFASHKSSAGFRQQPQSRCHDIYDFGDIRGTEADVRILLDAILIPFAKEMQMNIETEKSYTNKNLPSCKFDYRIRYKNDVVGLVEAKSRLHGSGIGPESVVQGILQLSALQAEVYGKIARGNPTNQQVDPLPLFNIISDGYQYIFIQLDHDKLLFDHQPGRNIYGEKMPTIRCYLMDSHEGMEEILVKMAKQMLQVVHWAKEEKEDENVEMKEEEDIVVYESDEEAIIVLD